MRRTKIPYPLDTDMSETEIKKHKETWKAMDDMKEDRNVSFDELLLIVEETIYLL